VPSRVSPAPTASYAERLSVPLMWWLLGAAFVVSVGWAFFVSTPLAAAAVAVVVTAGLVGIFLTRYGSVRLVVDAQMLRAGRAVLPREHVGAVEALDAERTRRAIGPDADARALLVTRPYCTTAVRVEVADPQDPTPYWLTSSRHPGSLVESLDRRAMRD
jgi:predicted signal transduction protein with EAL and GGDEF domain